MEEKTVVKKDNRLQNLFFLGVIFELIGVSFDNMPIFLMAGFLLIAISSAISFYINMKEKQNYIIFLLLTIVFSAAFVWSVVMFIQDILAL